jgi:hypothetical protein
MANPKKIQPGMRVKRFPAGTFNALVEGELRDRQANAQRPRENGGFSKSSIVVRLWWQGEAPLPPGSVVKLGEVIKDKISTQPGIPLEGLQFKCEEPTSDDSEEPCAITIEPIPANGLGYAHIPQATWALVTVTDDAHEFAKIVDGTELESNASTGFPIIWKEPGTGSGKWAVVSLSRPGGGLIKVLLTGDVSAASYNAGTDTLTPSEFTARVWIADGDNWTQSASDEKDCTNPYMTPVTVTAGSGRIAWVTAGGELYSVDCTEFVL